MYERIPNELRNLRQWGLFRRVWQEDKGKYTKIPHSALDGQQTSSTDASQWVTFDEALAALPNFGLDGLGFFFANGYVGIDVDHIATDLEQYKVGDTSDNVAWEFMSAFKSYTEISMSGEGIHIITKGEIPGSRRRKANVEMYQSGRFFAMTGNQFGPFTEVTEAVPEAFKQIYQKYLETDKVVPIRSNVQLAPNNLSSDEIIYKMLSSNSGDRIRRLLEGGWEQDYVSQSEADLAFANDLAFWTGRDFNRMDEIFRISSLMRDKWDEKHGKTSYGVATLNKAINDTNNVYHPENEKPQYNFNFAKEEKPKEFPPRSWDDTGNADRFVDRFGEFARYSYVNKNWYIYNGSYWDVDLRGQLNTMIDDLVGNLKDEKIVAPDDMDDKKDIVQEWAKFIKRSRSNKSKKAIADELKHRLPVMPNDFDKDHMIFNTLNGYVDLSNGQLFDHDIKKMFSRQSNVEYSDTMECPEWLNFLDQTFGGDQALIDYIQKAVGYSLTGSTDEQVMFILYGSGRNGKSVFMDTVKHIMGSYALTMQANSLMIKPNSNGANPDIARLKGSRLVSASEPNEGVRLDEGLIKELTGGESVTARELYGMYFEFKPEFKLWLSTNHKPIIRGTDDGIWRRLMLIPFNNQVAKEKVDRKLPYKLERESIGILNWAVDGVLKWQREGLKPPESVTQASDEYRNEMDTLELFLSDCCLKGPDYKAPAGELFDVYQEWADKTGEYKMRKQKFGAEMRKKLETKKTMTGRFYYGIKINQQWLSLTNDPRLNWNH